MEQLIATIFKQLKINLNKAESLSKTKILFYSAVSVLCLGVIDYATGPDFSFSIFYLFPVSFAAWFSGRKDGLKISLLAVIAAFIAELLWPKAGVHFLVRYWDALTELTFYAFSTTMLAEIKTIIVKEKEMSRTDFLTGISNARNFYELAEFEIKRAHRQNDLITIAYMDIDDFKRVNDTKGHMEGDLLLQTTADIIKTGTRQTDIIARLGGDEFVALMPAASGKQAQIVLERIRTEIHDTFKTKNWDATISIGAATCSGQNCSVENLIKSADCLMYEAKEAGKNRLVQRTIETVPVCSFKEISPAEQ